MALQEQQTNAWHVVDELLFVNHDSLSQFMVELVCLSIGHMLLCSSVQFQPLESSLRKYAAELGLNMEAVRFTFDGEQVNPSKSPDDLDMEDDDIIDARIAVS